MGIAKGTTLTDTPKDRTLNIRMDADTEQKLVELCTVEGKTKARVIRDGIDKQYEELIKSK